jgi:hypothetical protein
MIERELRDMKRMLGIPSQVLIESASDGTASVPAVDTPRLTTPIEPIILSDPIIPPEKATLLYHDVLLSAKSLEGISIDPYVIKNLLDEYIQ